MEPSQEMTLAQKVAAAREASKSQVIEGDVKKREEKSAEKAAKKAEREARREAREKKFKETVENAKQKVKSFREWDRRKMLEGWGNLKATPEVAKLTVEAGVEAGKKLANETREGIVEGARAVGNWVEDRCFDVKNFTETQTGKIVDGVEAGIDKAKMAFEEKKNQAVDKFMEVKKFTSTELTRGKNKVKEAWIRMEKGFAEDKTVRQYEKYQKLQEKANQARERFATANENTTSLHKDLSKVRAELRA